jgi:hypothetical protein
MDQENRTDSRLPEIVEYLRANPTPPADGPAIHLHEHHHYAPPPPAPPPPRPTVAEQVVPWVYLLVLVMIAATICAAILAVIGVILVAVLLAVAVVAAILAYLVRSVNEGAAVKALARDQGKRRR